MKFKLRPILLEIKDFYQQPVSKDRFRSYLEVLIGETGDDMALPIAGFNPMAKDHILEKIEELERLDAEGIMADAISQVNAQMDIAAEEIQVVLNIADDQKGAWTNFYTTDFASKFKLHAFVSRNFCVPHFWTSEQYTKKQIEERTKAYLFRTIYRLEKAKVKTLKEHLEQEIFVTKNMEVEFSDVDEAEYKELDLFYQSHQSSDDYNVIFNFFYGDEASASLGFKQYGVDEVKGYEYAKYKSRHH